MPSCVQVWSLCSPKNGYHAVSQELCVLMFTKSRRHAPCIPLDRAYYSPSDYLSRHPSQLPGQYELANPSAQELPYAVQTGHTYPRDMYAPRVTTTMDPSRAVFRPSPMPASQEDSASESEIQMVIADRGRTNQYHADDAAGWEHHPETIGLGIPEFHETEIKGDMRDAAGAQVLVVMHANFVLKKKAAKQRNFWILYRRNYFAIQSSYNLDGSHDSTPDETLYLYGINHEPKPIQALFMCMRGVVENEEGPEIKIVVFSPKRKPIHEGTEPPPIEPQRMKPLTEGSTKFFAESTGDRQDHLKVPMNHTFHRNQFRAATQNNGARRTEQQFYHILIELKAEILVDGVPKLFTVSSQMSDALVVRGRCPLSFKDKDEDKDKDGDIRNSDRKGARKFARNGSGVGSRRSSMVQRQKKEGVTKRASRGLCDKPDNSTRRSTRASSNLPSAHTNTLSPYATIISNETMNRETISHLDNKQSRLTREYWDGDPRWLDGHDS